MDEDAIFGPFTLRQFLYLAVGAIICYVIHTLWPTNIGYIVIVVVIGVTIACILNNPRVKIDAEYLQKKKSNSKNAEEYKRWLKMKIAIVQSLQMMRAHKHKPADPEGEALRALLEAELAKEGGEPFDFK